MFSFSNLFALLTEAPTIIAAGETAVATVETDIEALLANPAVKQIEAVIAANFTSTATPGAAAVIEPKTPAHSK